MSPRLGYDAKVRQYSETPPWIMLKNLKLMLNFAKCRFSRFKRFKPFCVLLRIIVHRKGNNSNLGREIAKNGYFCVFSETYLFGEAKIGGFLHNPSCAWMAALNRHFFAISLFIAADLPSWRHLCIIVWICCFPRNLFAFSLPVCWFAWYVLHRFIPLSQSSVVVCDLRIVFWIACLLAESDVGFIGFWDALMEINSKSQIISWCE